MTTRTRTAGLTVGALLLLSACGATPAPDASPATVTITATATATVTAAAPATATASSTPMDSGLPTSGIPTTEPSDVEEGQRTPADLAGAAMTAYQVTDPVDANTWFQRIAPYLTEQAAAEYKYTDPGQVTVHQLVGVPTLTRQTDYLAAVTQGTDDGPYLVSLSRDETGAWKVYRIDRLGSPASVGS